MFAKNPISKLFPLATISWYDVAVLIIILAGGLFYLQGPNYWNGGNMYIGETPFSDAQFWWGGAIQLAQGIFQDHPGKGFRPGYFILTGLTLPILGMKKFQEFHPYFLTVFLMIIFLFYLALRHYFYRWGAFCAIALIVFNPYTAQWLAISTTDGLGLTLNLTALACLLFGFNNGLHRNWLIAFAFFFALANLTRPLMNPFIMMVICALLFMTKAPHKQRLKIVGYVLLAFFAPLFLWMAVQKLVIDQWSLSSNDAGAFYAASTPDVQVWDRSMYNHIEQLAVEHYGDKTDKSVNRTFWIETFKNYNKYAGYHFNRIIPHFLKMISFSPIKSRHGTDYWRNFIFILLISGLSIGFFYQRSWIRGTSIALLAIPLCFFPNLFLSFLTAGGALFALFIKPTQQNNKLGVLLLSFYWLTGVLALYLIGGTHTTDTSLFTFSGLGLRVGTQLFFANDLLGVYCIVAVACFKYSSHSKKWPTWFFVPSPFAGKIIGGVFFVFIAAILGVYTIGSGIVLHRAYVRNTSPIINYPKLDSINDFYYLHYGNVPILAKGSRGTLNSQFLIENNNANLVFTGTVSPFIWNIPGQSRAQIMVYTQNQIYPYTMGPRYAVLEVPQQLSPKDWCGVQGAFIVRQMMNEHYKQRLPEYYSSPSIHAFVPLSADKRSFDLAKTIWFPLAKNAGQLETSGELKISNANVTWPVTSGPAPSQRRFLMVPKNKNSKQIKLSLDVTSARGPTKLSFAYSGDALALQNSPYYDILISQIGNTSQPKQILYKHEQYPSSHTKDSLKKVEFDIPANTKMIEITFNQLWPETGIWIYEFNLKADHFVQKATNQPLSQRS